MKHINFVKLLREYGVKAALGLSNIQALVVNFILNKIWDKFVKKDDLPKDLSSDNKNKPTSPVEPHN